MSTTTPRILIIAGSDSGGGAGVQADIKTVTMLGGHAMTAITAITAQNTLGVTAVHPVPAEIVLAQIDAVIDDLGVDAIKIGMIGSAFTAHVVADRLEQLEPLVPIVFDPVMVATSGAALADDSTVAAFNRLMDIATISTPNLPELQRLTGKDDPVEAALALVGAHGCAVMIKGGHDEGDALADALIEEDNITSWQGSRIDTPHTHGTGCTLASAIAVGLAEGKDLAGAIATAREFVRMALYEAPGLGQGAGPMGHQRVRLDVGGGPRLNQVTLTGKDYAKSVAFYARIGLKQIVDSPENGYARFESWGGGTLSIQIDPEEEMGPTTAIYLECDDLDTRVEQLARNGLPFEHGPRNQPWMWREARLRDPSGNIVFLYKAGEHRRYPPWRMEEADAPQKSDEPSAEPAFDSFEVKRAVLP
ncbi:bifunctional hydroxymethylpyrimidine kinase/phosphomethylpyrimidine kinase [Sphingomonas sp. KRR8]|uniref:bifunctional hydroxymethylpyrimidine kinase/phosphomethylpyrimidine kinase n=1 Tax=Sphingomonas sp. KRR8 TaxID=2942996 RepID=UPI002020DDAB|nr:bifunctional hydroxymethylpyrimidine kinase/phosphomethylpyrimidine kinase [Sphingomonas sp. KRR8]URD61709.1 bifunctional hydroxymethylpyrimidine kinase/phosphomethylpyrimidine kinase [Sphingomonas sp. KRR8]